LPIHESKQRYSFSMTVSRLTIAFSNDTPRTIAVSLPRGEVFGEDVSVQRRRVFSHAQCKNSHEVSETLDVAQSYESQNVHA